MAFLPRSLLTLATLAVLTGAASGCAKGGSAQFFEEAGGGDGGGSGDAAIKPSGQVVMGAEVEWVQDGVPPGTGYTGKVIVKPDSGSLHSGGAYRMRINSIRVE